MGPRPGRGSMCITSGSSNCPAPSTYPDRAESISPGPGPGEGVAQSDAVDGPDRGDPSAEPATTAERTGEGETGSPAVVDATPGDATDLPEGASASNGADVAIDLDAGADDGGGVGGAGGQLEHDQAEPETESAPTDTVAPADTQATAGRPPAPSCPTSDVESMLSSCAVWPKTRPKDGRAVRRS